MEPSPVFLIVEPSPALRKGLCLWLQTSLPDHLFLCAANGREAMSLASSNFPTISLIEIHLPDENGFEVARHLYEAAAPGIVVMTSFQDGRFFYEKARAVGADRFIPKYLLLSELLPFLKVNVPSQTGEEHETDNGQTTPQPLSAIPEAENPDQVSFAQLSEIGNENEMELDL